ncbi:hypothetical protein P154DRAFT_254280 [Amniculicola lignicola CBS 123094]|uniref:tRNA-splicing endonuclease subunit Sen15 domain-containing protein n=1 Tax=Amniculicola lignicola CBS 123094 TaxID=1392246 RepID=A0A6A5WX13_9PLEO|nr:hypothetical protein P154DRAFT_254280 [Amniculicola lignicola CBS 123094]
MACPVASKQPVEPAPIQQLVQDSELQSHSHLPASTTLALQIQHNLQYQHAWTDVRVHSHSPVTNEPLVRPLLSGLPPKRLYVHPDEQIDLLKEAQRQRTAAKQAGGKSDTLDVKAQPEREWVLPARLVEKWTLHRLSDIFDAITTVPPESATPNVEDSAANPWRTTKRVVLATADTDSTVVFYIVHDGVVKPRQN